MSIRTFSIFALIVIIAGLVAMVGIQTHRLGVEEDLRRDADTRAEGAEAQTSVQQSRSDTEQEVRTMPISQQKKELLEWAY